MAPFVAGFIFSQVSSFRIAYVRLKDYDINEGELTISVTKKKHKF